MKVPALSSSRAAAPVNAAPVAFAPSDSEGSRRSLAIARDDNGPPG